MDLSSIKRNIVHVYINATVKKLSKCNYSSIRQEKRLSESMHNLRPEVGYL